ncbi:hypothetical protein EII36_11030 [Staphylococcus epidermidis]|jgi:hypothetical protein|uniref:Type I toxin-antitoxin system Fst family toxin n=4 Tax=Staphylococcus TaxID=1279 RepID=Q5HS22_STAEQ|nr:hypothetical protein SE_2404 [Staphylococcus epidermidis ATCC 12228]AAW53416.1 hypothetical protein SERP0017 [Staphylococcus epidermidis RP62A]AIR82329.1 putative membrane protein [Staphylococcus epidermidis]ENL43789.1 hypothetical protein B467_02320 [Staphylococcus epidermidis M0881]ETJ10771.1 MAG: hypothetical protein Q614_SASC00351G0004 [Staphylococcus sp. DORA_6_22]EUR96944.1 hypothetical protein O237_01999 [Staphylococcus epidermidis M0026]MBA9941200.1 hypothetical protein [Ralstonia 
MVEILVNTAISVYIVALYTQWLSTRDNLKA